MPQLRYFQTERQRAQVADLIAGQAERKKQKPADGQEWVFDKLTEAAVQGSIGVSSVYDEGRITLNNGTSVKVTKDELDAEKVESDPSWKPEERPDAKLKTIALSESSVLYSSLLKAAMLENVVARKLNGATKFECLEAYLDNALNSHLRTGTAQMLLKDMQDEKRAVFSEKKEEEKPKEKKKQAPA